MAIKSLEMTGPDGQPQIPSTVPSHPLPEFEYDSLEKGEQIGTGGDADVYFATIEINSEIYPVAVKQPRFDGTLHQQVLERFQDEAETWAKLDDHDNIVSVYSWDASPVPWLALEHMNGGTLTEKIGAIDIPEALWLSGRIAEGIHHGHRHGVAHLDIKPSNILLRETDEDTWDYPKVSDWGLAKLLLEHSNSIEGISPIYAAPEQFDADEFGRPDDITDIYQFGTVVYALCTGVPPFTGSATSVMQDVLTEGPDPPSEHNAKISDELDNLILKALSKDKEHRHESIILLRKQLDKQFNEYTGTEKFDDLTNVTVSPTPVTDASQASPNTVHKESTEQGKKSPNTEPPFKNPSQLAKVSPNQGYFDGCPECVTGKVWFGQEDEEGENTLLMCEDCGAKWREVIKKEGLIFKNETRIGWNQVSGEHRGMTNTVEEWERL